VLRSGVYTEENLDLGDQGLVGFYRVSSDADQGQIWNCRQNEGTLGGDGIFSLIICEKYGVAILSLLKKYIPFWGFCTIS